MSASPASAASAAALPRKPARTGPARGLALRPRVLLCDLDGTLIDSMPVLADLATEVMTEVYAIPASLARELYVSTCGLPFIRQMEVVFPGDARNAGASATFEARKIAACSDITLADDVLCALEAIRALGIKTVVSSNNGVENVATFALRSAFTFDLTLGFGGGLAKGKPHLDRVADVFGVRRGDMLFVGDSLHDGEIAERESVPFVGVAGTFSYERFALRFPQFPVVRRFADLAALLVEAAGEPAPESSAARGATGANAGRG